MTEDYYSRRLAAERLQQCYKLAPPGVRAYLEGEVRYVDERAPVGSRLLELGCGYGRVLRPLARAGRQIVGIDTSVESLRMARDYLREGTRSRLRDDPCFAPRHAAGIELAAMNALHLGFPAASFDLVACLQNGISAFSIDPAALVREALRVTRPGGLVLFSSYAERFWEERLAWFRIQARHGLVGEIDEAATGAGVIVCQDGFRATTFGPGRFAELCRALGVAARIEEVGGASVFCEIHRAP